MKRKITDDLVMWKDSKRRKPLLLTGVRQCGKTYILKQFGLEYFDNMCYVNFESNTQYSAIFEYDFDISRILDELKILTGQTIKAGRTLLFFDEIQECPRAITSLKYFSENRPDLHVVAAGSLLGVALKQENISFPVGKVNRMQLYPMDFQEFLMALGQEKYIELFRTWDIDREISELYIKPLEKLLKTYYIVGGMPDAVSEYADSGNFDTVAKIQDDILRDYADDFSKHAPTSEIEKIRWIWESVPLQLAKENNKFIFSHVKQGKRAHELEGALQWLKNAGLIYLVEMVSNAEQPLSAYSDATYFKVYMADCGLLSRRLGLNYRNYFEDDNSLQTIKGAITENYVLCELLSQGKKPYFWRSGNTAEVDFIYESALGVVPVEVKAATNTQAKSYKQFCGKYNVRNGVKLSLKNIALNDDNGIRNISLPLYLTWNIDHYVK